MLIPDMPNVPPQNVPVMIAQANQAQPSNSSKHRTMGVCQIIPNSAIASPSIENVINPKVSGQGYFYLYEHQKSVAGTSSITILEQPKHGVLRLVTEADGSTFGEGQFDPTASRYAYIPEKGYFGKDSATALDDIGGIKVKVVYFFQTLDVPTVADELQETLCEKGPQWKISFDSSAVYSANSAVRTNKSNLAFKRDALKRAP